MEIIETTVSVGFSLSLSLSLVIVLIIQCPRLIFVLLKGGALRVMVRSVRACIS